MHTKDFERNAIDRTVEFLSQTALMPSLNRWLFNAFLTMSQDTVIDGTLCTRAFEIHDDFSIRIEDAVGFCCVIRTHAKLC